MLEFQELALVLGGDKLNLIPDMIDGYKAFIRPMFQLFEHFLICISTILDSTKDHTKMRLYITTVH